MLFTHSQLPLLYVAAAVLIPGETGDSHEQREVEEQHDHHHHNDHEDDVDDDEDDDESLELDDMEDDYEHEFDVYHDQEEYVQVGGPYSGWSKCDYQFIIVTDI